MSDIQSAAAAFKATADGVLTDASAALPTLETLFPGSTDAALAQFSEKLAALAAEAENTMIGWAEAVAQATPEAAPPV